ncbi:hypothetical protein BG011_007491 [Mortierella polycephala]|uniref:TOG domain-containing protein n=1 Tax=Mortierella polycephala TaxID=41804 RepID=A0A9P6U8S3_9FUNG|nr:hypothetical protein BG011_007491 [Mortierella polycephala]
MAVNLHYHDLDNVLSQPETEHNWAAKEDAIKTLGAACHSSIAHNQEFISFIKAHRKAFSDSLLTERTRLTGTACEMVEKLATSMGRDFGTHFADFFTGALLKLCARTNKVMVSRALKALNSIINAGCISTLPKACQAFATNNKTLRIACIGLIVSCIAQFSSQELEPFLASFEPVLKEGVSDAAPEVRDTSRKSFKIYAQKFPERSSRLSSTLPGNVLKYLLPDTRSAAPSRITSLGRPSSASGGRFGADAGELARHQSSRELNTGMTRAGPSRVGPVRARTMAIGEQGSTSTFKVPTLANQHAASSPQPYGYSNGQHASSQGSHNSITQQPQMPMRNNGPSSRGGSFADTSESGSHGAVRLVSQRSRSNNSMTTGAMIQRSPSINLATNGGAQRMAPAGTRPSSVMSRVSKTEPVLKTNRLSMHSSNSGHGASTERDHMSASDRAKAYSANLKSEMANRRASELSMRTSSGARRIAVDNTGHATYSSSVSSSASTPVSVSTSTSSDTSTASTSAATSTASTSPPSSLSTSPTTRYSPNHDPLFSSFRAPASPRGASSPPESCPSPDPRHSTPPASQQSDGRAVSAPLSPTVLAQVSLEAGAMDSESDHTSVAAESQSPHSHEYSSHQAMILEHAPTPLSPHSPLHQQTPISPPPAINQSSENGPPPRSPFTPTSPLQEKVEAVNQVHEIGDLCDGDTDVDLNMSIPDHESLFGNTDNYLQMEQEISGIQQAFESQSQNEACQEAGKSSFMDEDLHSIEQEQQAVRAYADEYEAALAAASCSSASLPSVPSSHEEV